MMKKRINCAIRAFITVEVDIPDRLLEEFNSDDVFRDWGRGKDNSEIYELLNDEICRNSDDLYWSEIEIYESEDIIDDEE